MNKGSEFISILPLKDESLTNNLSLRNRHKIQMTNFWLFQAVDITVGRKKYLAEQIFEKRIKAGFWGLKSNAPNIKRLKPDDKIAFYIGGEFKHHIAGIGIVTSSVHDITEEERLDLYPEEGYTKAVSIKIERIFKPVIDEARVNLSLPRLKTGRASLRSTISPLTAEDFKKIELLPNSVNETRNRVKWIA